VIQGRECGLVTRWVASSASRYCPAAISDGNLAFAQPLDNRLRVVSGISSGGPAPDTDGDGLGYICE
jgi:hypothetical protein